MAIATGGGGRRGGRRRFRPMADINVTPMVDVMLVLLVIFMITAPLLTAGVPVDLPKTNAGQMKGDDQPISVTVDSKGRIFLQETEVQLDELAARLRAITNAKPDNRIFVRGDSGINYGRVMEVMGQLSAAGFPHVALVTQPAAELPRKGAR
ncbi:protein TolR [Telmatospirillum sp.]|uniref:protein TolR n=1 Tax=Telmatospirillum sp. TaxID=2079197 RepID=UPI00284CEC95|nr:protein TolR [Telmatospirillum sp.]MDR3437957.1 protein TolR [Telmatospirillum sp.]